MQADDWIAKLIGRLVSVKGRGVVEAHLFEEEGTLVLLVVLQHSESEEQIVAKLGKGVSRLLPQVMCCRVNAVHVEVHEVLARVRQSECQTYPANTSRYPVKNLRLLKCWTWVTWRMVWPS
jgi:hypothetical protein